MQSSPDSSVPSSEDVQDLLLAYRKLVAGLRRSEALSSGDVDRALRQVTELAAQVLRVDRASVWRLTEGGSRIVCLDLFRRDRNEHARLGAVDRSHAVQYFSALETERCIVADDAMQDPRTSALASYLAEHGIGAMLDAPVFLHGTMIGVVCHEHVGKPRVWAFWEELVAGTMADFVALVIEAEELLQARAEAQQYREEETAIRNVFDAAPVPLVMARSDGTIELFNPRAREVLGIPDDVKPGAVQATRFYADLDFRASLLADVHERGFIDAQEFEMKTWSGEVRWALASVRRITYRGTPHVIMGFTEIRAQKELEAKLRDAAVRDPLLGIHNRRFFFEAAATELERARRYNRPIAVAMLDADHFKGKNDQYGHLVGDELLIAFGRVAASELRQSDIVARYGGEELVIIFPETELDAAEAVTNRIRTRLADAPQATTAGPVTMTCSGGVVAWNRDENIAELVDRADRALYVAKSWGRNRVERG